MKIVKYIFCVLKDFTIYVLQGLLLLLFCGVIAIPLMFLLSVLPIFVANLTNSAILFGITYVVEFILIDLALDGQSDMVDYFINKWKEIK